MATNESGATNPGTWIGLALVGGFFWLFVHWWALIPIGIVAFVILCMPNVYKAMEDDRRRKINARKMRRELRMENRMNLAQEYVRRHGQ